ncbi:alpha/beta fold hydrolase [Nocardia cyriacigeorgica]|uniref:alpha/beta fold hydrolase n=1 Tax=Nocardia cyriacigeorgica TaxID=135487 RepID=UPI003F686C7F
MIEPHGPGRRPEDGPDRRWRIPVDGIELAGFEWGDPAAPPLVLVHGASDTHRTWEQVAVILADEFRVITYDVRGHGQSGAPHALGDYRLDRLADDLYAVIDTVSPDRPVHLAGHGWGAVQGWEAVLDPRAHPDRLVHGAVGAASGPPRIVVASAAAAHRAHGASHAIAHGAPDGGNTAAPARYPGDASPRADACLLGQAHPPGDADGLRAGGSAADAAQLTVDAAPCAVPAAGSRGPAAADTPLRPRPGADRADLARRSARGCAHRPRQSRPSPAPSPRPAHLGAGAAAARCRRPGRTARCAGCRATAGGSVVVLHAAGGSLASGDRTAPGGRGHRQFHQRSTRRQRPPVPEHPVIARPPSPSPDPSLRNAS